jgi:ABC-2 type transport system permease protein
VRFRRPAESSWVSGFRWSCYGVSDVSVGISLGMTALLLGLCLVVATWIFRTGYRLKQ